MRYKIIILFIPLLAFPTSSAQQREKRKYVVVPAENILIAIASQPDCAPEILLSS